jgi:hypothetical protein
MWSGYSGFSRRGHWNSLPNNYNGDNAFSSLNYGHPYSANVGVQYLGYHSRREVRPDLLSGHLGGYSAHYPHYDQRDYDVQQRRNHIDRWGSEQRIANEALRWGSHWHPENEAARIASEGNLRHSLRRMRTENEVDFVLRRY